MGSNKFILGGLTLAAVGVLFVAPVLACSEHGTIAKNMINDWIQDTFSERDANGNVTKTVTASDIGLSVDGGQRSGLDGATRIRSNDEQFQRSNIESGLGFNRDAQAQTLVNEFGQTGFGGASVDYWVSITFRDAVTGQTSQAKFWAHDSDFGGGGHVENALKQSGKNQIEQWFKAAYTDPAKKSDSAGGKFVG